MSCKPSSAARTLLGTAVAHSGEVMYVVNMPSSASASLGKPRQSGLASACLGTYLPSSRPMHCVFGLLPSSRALTNILPLGACREQCSTKMFSQHALRTYTRA